MRFKSGLVIGIFFWLVSMNSAFAGTLQLEYKSFYSHLRKLNNEELALLQFAFGFQHVTSKQLCTVNSVVIKTDKKDIPISISADKRFVLPSEKALKLANAEVIVELVEPNNQCDLSVKLQIDPNDYSDGVTTEKLSLYFKTFEAFFDEMGGFLAFMMPSPEGLILSGTNISALADFKGVDVVSNVDGQYKLAYQNIEKINTTLNGIDSITAWMP